MNSLNSTVQVIVSDL